MKIFHIYRKYKRVMFITKVPNDQLMQATPCFTSLLYVILFET